MGMGGRDLVYKYMGFVVESVLEQACIWTARAHDIKELGPVFLLQILCET